ncbi:MAG: ThuA domain-containing protein [Chitinophagaceae bacterium]
MQKISFYLLTVLLIGMLSGCNKRSGKPRILVFSKTSGFYHTSIPKGLQAIQKLGAENGFDVDTTVNAAWFTDDTLKKYATVVFLNTTGNVLDNKQEIAFERYIQSGGNFVGIHSATDTEYDWGWYGNLVGAYFNGHPKTQQATLDIKDNQHVSTKHLPAKWTRTDEWYNFKKLKQDVHVLITIDEKSYEGGTNDNNHPMAWYHEYDGGRSFYTELGHTDESYTDTAYLKHILGGIQYAIGKNRQIDFGSAKSVYPPDEDRFAKTTLTQGTLYEPTELTVLPNLDILISQRRGEILLYKNDTKEVKPAGLLNVFFKKTEETSPGGAEEGLLGIQADPDFKKNSWVYVFYSPADTPVNRLSRFEFKNDAIDMKSEKVILQFYSQRNICCHTGGSIAFGPDRTVFISTGDNSTPFNEPNKNYVSRGFAPLDDRPGHIQYDSRRSAGNTNDLRGKIIRIKINDDATYTIPDGNLFPKGEANARPEIYVMGNRNPYRISVDAKTGFLYWGEVGPDSNVDSMDTRGPMGYDEINQARKAGFFGWPLFVGNNIAYREYDYNTGVSGAAFDPAKPMNSSKNNTGLKELPPAQPAFIWYSYSSSNDFPQIGAGGRTAMAGPVYYTEFFPKDTRYNDYYNGKLFIYEWIRDWIKVVTLKPNGDFDKMEPFMEHTRFAAPIDMEVGPDGKLYVLEYGKGWFSKNPDAGISRIDFNSGNRAPKIAGLTVDKTSGSLPFKIRATVKADDPEKDKLKYAWSLGNGITKETTEPTVEFTYDKTGDYAISVEVSDDKKASSKSATVAVYAGNEEPMVDIQLTGNKSFYFPGSPVKYNVMVQDKDDPSSTDLSNLRVMADYVEGVDKAAVPPGHLSVTETEIGKNLMLSSDCKACHQTSEKSVGPAYTQVAVKYKKDPKASAYLVDKIKKGGAGVWGEVAMPAHPDLPNGDVQQIVKWILSLSNEGEKKSSLPAAGAVKPGAGNKGFLYLTASYTDKGGAGGGKPLTAKKTLVFRNSLFSMKEVKNARGFTSFDSAGTSYLVTPKGEGSFVLDSIDLSGISEVALSVLSNKPIQYGYTFELRLDGLTGRKLGEAVLEPSAGKKVVLLKIPMEAVNDAKFHNLYLVSRVKDAKEPNTVRLQSLRFAAP